MCSPQTCSRPDKRSEGFKTTTTEKEALHLEMRQRDVRHMRVVTLSAQTCGNRVLQRHASRLSMGMRRENVQRKQQHKQNWYKIQTNHSERPV